MKKIVTLLLILMISGFVFAEEKPAVNDSTMVKIEVVTDNLGTTKSILNLNQIGYRIQSEIFNFFRNFVIHSYKENIW